MSGSASDASAPDTDELRQLPASVRDDFIVISNTQVKCRRCPTKLTRNGSTTSNLLNHVKRKHSTSAPSQTMLQNAFAIQAARPPMKSFDERLSDALVKLFVSEDLAFVFNLTCYRTSEI